MTTHSFFKEQLDTETGQLWLITDGKAVRAIDWADHEHRLKKLLQRHYGNNIFFQKPTQPSQALHTLQFYFAGELEAVNSLRTTTNGTEFQQKVWNELRKIPAGHTISYTQLAANIGKPKAIRAVGLANGANPIPIVVPCHRVIGANFSLTGFAGGLARKEWLLIHENALPTSIKHRNSI